MSEDRNDTQLPLSSVLAEKEARLRREAGEARQRADLADRAYEQSINTTGRPIPQALKEAVVTEKLARSLEEQHGLLAQDVEALDVSSMGHSKKPGGRKLGRHSSVPLNLLRPLPGMAPPTTHAGRRSR